jgi:hypothetical protein
MGFTASTYIRHIQPTNSHGHHGTLFSLFSGKAGLEDLFWDSLEKPLLIAPNGHMVGHRVLLAPQFGLL